MTDRPEHVPFLDLRAAYRELQRELDAAAHAVLASGSYLLGAELDAFEREFAAYVGADHCVGVANGLDALVLTLRAIGIESGDEVLVPSNTFIATWLAVSAVGAVPVPVEPDPRSFNMDPDRIASAITSRTRAVLPVHLYGQPADLGEIRRTADARGIRMVEDAAQAHGARIGDRRVGGADSTATWSFYPGKNLGAFGDGGAVTTGDGQLAARLRALRNYGSTTKYVHDVLGTNSRLDDVQAALLRVKLRHLDRWNERRAGAAQRYTAELGGHGLLLPEVAPFATPSWHLYVVRAPARDLLRSELERRGIGAIVHYPTSPHLQQAYAHLGYRRGDFPIAERLQDEVLSLPIGPHFSARQQSAVIDAVHEIVAAPVARVPGHLGAAVT